MRNVSSNRNVEGNKGSVILRHVSCDRISPNLISCLVEPEIKSLRMMMQSPRGCQPRNSSANNCYAPQRCPFLAGRHACYPTDVSDCRLLNDTFRTRCCDWRECHCALVIGCEMVWHELGESKYNIGYCGAVSMREFTNGLRWSALALCLSMASILVAACGGDESTAGTPISQQTAAPAAGATAATSQPSLEVGNRVGQMAPSFALTTAAGENLNLDSFQGRPVILYFFATW